MPKLPDIRFRDEGKNGDIIDFKASVLVTGAGEFSASIPIYLEESARGLLDKTAKDHQGVAIDYGHQLLRVYGPQLATVEKFVKAAMKDHLDCDVQKEDVIAYRYTSGVHYWKTRKGNCYPNGYFGRDQRDEGGTWRGAEVSNGNSCKDYSIKFAAFALVKSTYTRKGSKKVVFERWEDADNLDYSDPRAKLNAFNHLAAPVEDEQTFGNTGFTFVPYTPEAATFFYQVMISLCMVDDRMATFFADKAKVAKAIAAQEMPRLLA